jgi:hypothetical protein
VQRALQCSRSLGVDSWQRRAIPKSIARLLVRITILWASIKSPQWRMAEDHRYDNHPAPKRHHRRYKIVVDSAKKDSRAA